MSLSDMIKDYARMVRKKWHNDILFHSQPAKNFYNNAVLCQQGTACKTAEYEYHYALHDLLGVMDAVGDDLRLMRIGRKNDGGYVMLGDRRYKGFSKNKVAYSLGICDDVSFDMALAQLGYDVYQYDHTISSLPTESDKFHWKKIGITGETETVQLKHLATLIENNGHSELDGMLLKSDIEGAEWKMLLNCEDDIIKKFDQIVIELHDLLDYSKRELILKTLFKLNKTHQAVYVHPNNCTGVSFCGNLVTPETLEVTFLLKGKYTLEPTDKIFPTVLDQPNTLEAADILLGQWNVT